MTYRGHVKAGVVVFDEPAELPEGTEVKIELVDKTQSEPTIWEKLDKYAGTVEGPVDWAENHDHYLYGTPKREKK